MSEGAVLLHIGSAQARLLKINVEEFLESTSLTGEDLTTAKTFINFIQRRLDPERTSNGDKDVTVDSSTSLWFDLPVTERMWSILKRVEEHSPRLAVSRALEDLDELTLAFWVASADASADASDR